MEIESLCQSPPGTIMWICSLCGGQFYDPPSFPADPLVLLENYKKACKLRVKMDRVAD